MATKAQLLEVIREELVNVWTDLEASQGRSLARYPQRSMDMDWLIERIRSLTSFVSPVKWEEVPVTLLKSGLFQTVNQEMGITVDQAGIDAWFRERQEFVCP